MTSHQHSGLAQGSSRDRPFPSQLMSAWPGKTLWVLYQGGEPANI